MRLLVCVADARAGVDLLLSPFMDLPPFETGMCAVSGNRAMLVLHPRTLFVNKWEFDLPQIAVRVTCLTTRG